MGARTGRSVDGWWCAATLAAMGWLLSGMPVSAALLVFDRSISEASPYYTDIALDASGNLLLSGFALVEGIPRALISKRSPDGATEIWSLQFGAGQGQIAAGVAVDGQGNVYVSGWTSDPNFPLKDPMNAAFGGGDSDVFILKINAAGTSLLYSTFLGGSDKDFGNQIRVDGAGNVYVSGTTFSPDFPNTGAAASGQGDAFVVKLDPAGSTLVYARVLGGSGAEFGNGLALDTQGRAYLIGSTTSTNLPVGSPLQADNRGSSDAFVSILDSSGKTEYATYLGGSAVDIGTGIAVDASGGIFITGFTLSADFPLVRPFQNRILRNCPDGQGCGDAFVAKLNPAGSALEFSTFLGGSQDENSTAVTSSIGFSLYGVAVDAAGFAYVTGTTASADFPILGGLQGNRRRGSSDPFLAKLQPDGAIVYAAYLGPGQIRAGEIWSTFGSSVAVDGQGAAYVAGASIRPKVGSGSASPPRGYLAKVLDLPMIPTNWTPLPVTDGASQFLHITSVRRLADLSSQLSFEAPTNSGYSVEGSTDLRAWTNLFSQPPPGQTNGGGKR
jgi:hypothetical protein